MAKDERIVGTMKAIKNHLWVKTPVGVIARYEGDSYHIAIDLEPCNVCGDGS